MVRQVSCDLPRKMRLNLRCDELWLVVLQHVAGASDDFKADVVEGSEARGETARRVAVARLGHEALVGITYPFLGIRIRWRRARALVP